MGTRDAGLYIGDKDRFTRFTADGRFSSTHIYAFYQESSGMTRTHEGTGLGLTITKRLTELMGGTMAVETEKGRGCLFTVAFARTTPADREPRQSAALQGKARQEIRLGNRSGS